VRYKAFTPEGVNVAPTHVLVPLDGSPLADDALSYALDVFDCRITVLNVVTPIEAGMSEGGIIDTDGERTEKARGYAEEVIESARNRATSVDRTVDSAIETGKPAETILEYVETTDVDHVVMGGHGGPRVDALRRLLGTVATTVVGKASVPVTVVR
jgi:nucleotide-binding universal stress UspA family protein